MKLFKISYNSFAVDGKRFKPTVLSGFAVAEDMMHVKSSIIDLTNASYFADLHVNIYNPVRPMQKVFLVTVEEVHEKITKSLSGVVTMQKETVVRPLYCAVPDVMSEEELINQLSDYNVLSVTLITDDVDYSIQGWRLLL